MFIYVYIFQYVAANTMDLESEQWATLNEFLAYMGIITHFMCYFNSAINPIIYYFMSAQFKVK